MSMLINYTWEVLDVAATNKVDVGVGRDMFVANLNNYGIEGAEFYPGADVDYEALSAQWKALTPAEQANEKIALRQFMADHIEDIIETRKVGSKAKYYDIILNYVVPEGPKAPDYLLYKNAWEIWDKANKDGTDLTTAKDAYVETLEGWSDLTDEKKAEENEWFSFTVAPYDKGLIYAYDSGNRALFESILATR